MKYQVEGTPSILHGPPQISAIGMTPDQMEIIMERDDQAVFPVVGDCMEKAGIEDGGWVAVDFTHMPRAPKYGKDGYQDACMCLAVWPGKKFPDVMVKSYCGKWGSVHTVGTKYDNWKDGEYRIDVGLLAEKIYGVVFAIWGRDGRLKWKRDPAEFPTELPTVSTVRAGNVGDPEIVK